MKLSNVFPQIKAEKVQVKRSESPAPGGTGGDGGGQTDRVQLSAGSYEVQKMRDILAQTHEVRADKVQALKEQIAGGEYWVDVHEIADKMLISLLSENPRE